MSTALTPDLIRSMVHVHPEVRLLPGCWIADGGRDKPACCPMGLYAYDRGAITLSLDTSRWSANISLAICRRDFGAVYMSGFTTGFDTRRLDETRLPINMEHDWNNPTRVAEFRRGLWDGVVARIAYDAGELK